MCRRNIFLLEDARTNLIPRLFENEIYDMMSFPNVLMKEHMFWRRGL